VQVLSANFNCLCGHFNSPLHCLLLFIFFVVTCLFPVISSIFRQFPLSVICPTLQVL
jgi:uncharacterized integral membrane protein